MGRFVGDFLLKKWVPFGALVAALGAGYVFGAAPATAVIGRTECYERKAFVPYSEELSTETQVWCYRFEDDGSRFIYMVDSKGAVHPEVAVLVRPDGTLRHASLNAGRLTLHSIQIHDSWNPLGIPLEVPDGAKRVPEPIRILSKDGTDEVIRIQSLIGGEPPAESESLPYRAVVEVGDHESEADYLPWRGFWYPYNSGKLHTGVSSPLAKYDRFVKKRIGVHPGAQEWEAAKHGAPAVNWAGHCNGWAAASILRPEPTESVTDPFTNIEFTVADQKGLWMEADYCPIPAFFGERNNGRGRDGDIRVVDFHNVISYFLGKLKKPVIMDLMSNRPVENRVVSAYKMNVTQQEANVFKVTTTLTIHSYDGRPNSEVGPAGVFKRTYKYLMEVDEEGKPVKGKWLSKHPDFIWVPMKPAECKSKNPYVHEAWLKEIHRLSLREPSQPLVPAADTFPVEAMAEPEDNRPLGAAPRPGATPLPADRQPDGED